MNDYPSVYDDGYQAINMMVEWSGIQRKALAVYLAEEGYWSSAYIDSEQKLRNLIARFNGCLNPTYPTNTATGPYT
ncbi:MAG: hypothetical protein M3H12_02395 [Chromatiales bacterium]|nr:hypothetical protein [Gammaproteobacteria bacterium]